MIDIVPRKGFYFSKDDIKNARKNIKQFLWAEDTYRKLKHECDEFLRYTDEQIYECVLGMKGQAFAYGIAGCPCCNKPFAIDYEMQNRYLSKIEELPVKKVICPNCGISLPNNEYPDNGNGIEIEGKGYYFIGIWNFFTAGALLGGVHNHEGMVTKLTYMYMLSGNRNYAHKALVILDAFSAIFPDSIGPRDFTEFNSEFEIGRLHLLTSIVHRVKVFLAHDYDWLYYEKELDKPSPALMRLKKSGTMRQNIENMLNDYMLEEKGGPEYNLQGGNLTNLQNHEADGVRAMLAVGIVLDNDDYCRWGVQAVEAYLYNTIGNDGMYYEGSYGYALFAAGVFLDIAFLAMKVSDPLQLKKFQPFNSNRFFKFAVQNPLKMLCQGRIPCYGDWGKDVSTTMCPDKKIMAQVYRAALYFYNFSSEENIKGEALNRLYELYPMISSELGIKGMDMFFAHPEFTRNKVFAPVKENTIMGQAGVAILRGGNYSTLLMRVGQNNTHCHDDVLAYTYYDRGKEISADFGYGIYGTNAHYGWASKGIAHNTVVVNKDGNMKRNQIYKPFAGGEFSCIYESDHVALVEGKAPQLYGIEAYQRLLGLVTIDDRSSYIVDFFYVKGAKVSDFAYHAFHHESHLAISGGREVPIAAWTLAGVDAVLKPYYDFPGKSFGERLTTGETFSSLLKHEKGMSWTTRPNNGYGFIYDIHEFLLDREVLCASWNSLSGQNLKLWEICDKEDRIFVGKCPDLQGISTHPILVIRSYSPTKQYAGVVQTQYEDGHVQVMGIKKLKAQGRQVTALCVELSSGQTDLWAYTPYDQSFIVETPFGEWTLEGRCGWIRIDNKGHVLSGGAVCGSSMKLGEYSLKSRKQKWSDVTGLDAINRVLYCTNQELGHVKYARVKRRGASMSSLYNVEDIEKWDDKLKVILEQDFILSKGIVFSFDSQIIKSLYPLPLAISPIALKMGCESPFVGKVIKGEKGGYGIIKAVTGFKTIEIECIRPFSEGEKFDIYDIEIGDKICFI